MSMFAPPSVRSYQNPGDQLEPMTRYIVTLISFEDTGVSIYEKNKNKPDAEHSILWKWNVHSNDGLPIFDGDDMWEFWEWTSNRTGMRQDGTPSGCRARLQALIGRDLSDEEVTRFVSDQTNLDKMVGRKAFATFGKKRKKNQDGSESDELKTFIQALMPYRPSAQPAAPPPAPMPVAAAIPTVTDLPFDPPAPVADDQPLI